MEKTKKVGAKKLVIKNKGRFIFVLVILGMILVVSVILLLTTTKVKIEDTTDISALNATKYANEIKAQYEQEGMKDTFVQTYYEVKNAIGMYIMNHATLDDNSFEEMRANLNAMLEKKDWSLIEIQKPTFWNGTWVINDSGNVIFQFASRDIEPSWIDDTQVLGTVIKN